MPAIVRQRLSRILVALCLLVGVGVPLHTLVCAFTKCGESRMVVKAPVAKSCCHHVAEEGSGLAAKVKSPAQACCCTVKPRESVPSVLATRASAEVPHAMILTRPPSVDVLTPLGVVYAAWLYRDPHPPDPGHRSDQSRAPPASLV